MSESKNQKRAARVSPAVVPMGFQFGKTAEFLFVDFIDVSSDEDISVFFSVALTKSSAGNLKSALEDFLKSEK